MNDSHSSSNSPTDFAFAAPALPQGEGIMADPKSYINHMSPPNQAPFAYPANFSFHAGSSFSSSGSATGTSFSSADTSMAALPAISRDFARPSVTETRRPATAGGALVTRPFNMNMEPPIQEEAEQVTPDHHHVASVNAVRRSSESQLGGGGWASFDAFSGMNMLNPQAPPFVRQPLANARPQTSDGVPAPSYGTSLPSIGQHIDYSRMPYRAMPEMAHNTFPGDRAYSMNGVRPSYVSPPMNAGPSSASMTDDGSLQFVSLGGPAPKKRPRRRFDEIERLYLCGWNGCEKSYGTLNHLNAHVAMQKHGEKRLPTEFKEMRKQWRKKKREQTAAVANGQSSHMGGAWNRTSMSSSSSSDYDRRESTMSLAASGSDFGRGSVYSTYGLTDSRPTTAGSMVSSDGRPGTGYSAAAPPPAWGYGPGAARRVSAPTHIPMPPQMPENGFRPVEGDHPTPTPQNPFPQISHNGRQYFQQQTLAAPMAAGAQLNGQFDQFAFR